LGHVYERSIKVDQNCELIHFSETFFFRDDLTYSIVQNVNDDSSKFDVNATSGHIYVQTTKRHTLASLCDESCTFVAKVNDGDNFSEINVEIVPLSESQIIPLQMNNVSCQLFKF